MPKQVVVDASVAMKAILPNPLQGHCQALIATFVTFQPVAPALWAYETTSAITKTVYFGHITESEGRTALKQLDALGVQLFMPTIEQNWAAFNWTIRLRRAAAYDSYYLALAQTLSCSLWTADHRLFNALKNENLGWLRWIEEIAPLS